MFRNNENDEIKRYKDALFNALNILLLDYEERIANNQDEKDKHVTTAKLAKYTGIGAAAGTGLGAAAGAGIGAPVGSGVGILVGVIAACIEELNNRRTNKKFHTAQKVKKLLGENRRDVLKTIASRVVDKMKPDIQRFESENDLEGLAQYLAANMMSAVKRNGEGTQSPIEEVAIEGLLYPRSKKGGSGSVKNKNGTSTEFSIVARHAFFGSPATAAAVGEAKSAELKGEEKPAPKRSLSMP